MVYVKYGSVVVGVKEKIVPTASNSAEFSNIEQLKYYNYSITNYANPCDLYAVSLDGESLPLTTDGNEKIGYWSNSQSDDDGLFETPIEMIFQSTEPISCSGINFGFDKKTPIYPTHILVEWFNGDDVIYSSEYEPQDGTFFANNAVEGFDKLRLVVYSLNLPQNRFKLFSIDFGKGIIFSDINLREISIIQEIDPLSTELPINTSDFTVFVNENDLNFSENQPLSTYYDDQLISTTFINSAKQISKNLWRIFSDDYIGTLDEAEFEGGMYSKKNAVELILEICNVAGVPVYISDDLNDEKISGYIPYTTCRYALTLVAMAIGAIVDTSFSDQLKIYPTPLDISQHVDKDRIMQGITVDASSKITSVSISSHSYVPIDEEYIIYDSIEDGLIESGKIIFNEPLHALTITNGEILRSGTNYAEFTALEGCKIAGKKYRHRTASKTMGDKKPSSNKTANIADLTLITEDNLDIVLNRCYNYLANNISHNAKIAEKKHISGGDFVRYGNAIYGEQYYGGKTEKKITYDKSIDVGSLIQISTAFMGDITGRVTKTRYNLNGGIVVKNCEIKQID